MPPQPGQVLLGYELYQPPAGCCMCDGLSPAGLIAGEVLMAQLHVAQRPPSWVACFCFNS